MKRSRVRSLADEHWFKPLEGQIDDLEVCLIPRAAGAAINLSATTSDQKSLMVCREAFVNFRGYTEDDGTPVPNTLAARREIYSVLAVQVAIDNELARLNSAVLEGEGVAASA